MSDRTTPAESADRLRRFARMIKLPPGDNLLEDAARIIDRLSSPSTAPAVGGAPGDRFDFLTHLARQREWSGKTFGPGDRAKGVVDHIRKELLEIEADPTDLSEWIDVVILALDGAWRAGYSPEQILAQIVGKQAKNEARNWPDWRTQPTDKAIEHDRSVEKRSALVPLNTSEKRVSREEVIEAVAKGYDTWAAKPHNKKWVRKLDGTPIPNDIVVCIQDAILALNPEHAKEQEASDG